jgi:PEGA domain
VTSHTQRMRIGLVVTVCAALVGVWTSDASAQRRGGPARGRVSTVYVGSPYYFLGYGYYDPFWWGYPGWGWGPYGSDPYFRPDSVSENIGSARLQVKPRTAEVYVDGHLAGTVDDFDGFLQRLEVPAGEHDLTLHLDGYRTFTQKVLFRPGATLDIKYELQKLGPGEIAEPRPQAPPPPAGPPPSPERTDTRPARGRFGTLALRVQPADAVVFVDGEQWSAPQGDGPVLIELTPGTHDVEIRKQGLSTFRKTVRVDAGQTVPLNVSLAR